MDEARLKSIPLFAGLSRRERKRVAACADEVEISEGKKLVSRGTFAFEFLVIEEGTAAVTAGELPVAELGPGDLLGEVGAAAGALRNTSVAATSPMTIVVMNARDLRHLRQAIPHVHERLERAIESRAAELALSRPRPDGDREAPRASASPAG